LLGVDTRFWASLLFLYAHARRGMTAEWPDIIASAVAGPVLPLTAVALVGAAWLARRRVPRAFLCLVASLAVWGFFWSRSAASGLTPRGGRYGMVVYLTTVLYAAHVVGALVAAGVSLGKSTMSPFLGRFLAFLTGVGCLVVLLVFLW